MEKKQYMRPIVKMIDFVYDTQVVAESIPTYDRGEKTQWEWFDKCQARVATCELLYYESGMTCDLHQGTHFSLRP